MGARMRTRPIARKGDGAPSRKLKREGLKSAIRKKCQTQTRGAANRAAKELTGKMRKLSVKTISRRIADEPLADWERQALRNSAVISMMP